LIFQLLEKEKQVFECLGEQSKSQRSDKNRKLEEVKLIEAGKLQPIQFALLKPKGVFT